MKGYRTFLFIFVVLFALYIVAEINRPTPVDWSISLSKKDKKPYGGFVLYAQLRSLFPGASIAAYRKTPYHQLNNFNGSHTAYLLLGNSIQPSKTDLAEYKNYVQKGNYIFLSAMVLGQVIPDSFKLTVNRKIALLPQDSTSINFVNDRLKTATNYTFKKFTIDEYFSKFDTANSIVLGTNNSRQANFIKIPFGKGAFFIHAAPLCFSNYFMLHNNNAAYTATALSFLPANLSHIYWDEFYKLGPEGEGSPLRFFLSNLYLRWALRLAVIGMIVFVLFEMKRRQRIIPVILPLRNTTLDFVKTVSTVYFNQKDNAGIAHKKMNYLMEFIRNKYHLQTHLLDDDFISRLSGKSGVSKDEITKLIYLLNQTTKGSMSDAGLLQLNQYIDQFYKQVQ